MKPSTQHCTLCNGRHGGIPLQSTTIPIGFRRAKEVLGSIYNGSCSSKQTTKGGPTVCILKWDVAGKHCTLAGLGTENRNSRETRKKLKKARRGQRISFLAMACSRRLISLSCLTEAWGAKASWPCCRRPLYGCLLNRVRRCVCSAIESRALCIKIVAFASICAVYPSKGQLGAQGLIPSTGFEELSPKNATA